MKPLAQVKDAFESARVATGRRTTELSRQGLYLEAAAVLERELAAWPDALAPYPEAETRPLLERWTKWQREGIATLQRRAEWTAKASTDLAACRALILDLLEQTRWDVDHAQVTDARVQVLLDAARSLDLRTMQLFGPRRVHVVIEAPTLTDDQRRQYAKGLVTELATLGLSASATEGDERFVVTATVDGPHSMHYVHDTFCECSLIATAEWEGSGLPRIELLQHGSGDEELDDCVDRCVEAGCAIVAKRVLRAWAAQVAG